MSFQSDLLCQEDQNYLLDNVDLNLFSDLQSNEETLSMDEIQEHKFNILKNIPTNGEYNGAKTILCNEEYNGPFGFEVDVLRPNGSKNSWVYSSLLNKVYMDMKCPFPVDFRVTTRPPFHLFIRITTTYSSPQFAQECVYRCPNHEFNGSPNEPLHMKPHVIKCNNPDTVYLGDKTQGERLSLCIPFAYPQTGTDNVREMFEFLCKNSCPSPGMNRRAIEVIFTLEDANGETLGRKALNVRVCSCPKRDKEKDEKDNSGKPPQGKKRKMDKTGGKRVPVAPNDLQETILKIPVIGKHNKDQILKYVQDLYSGEILRHENDAEAEHYKRAFNKITAMIKESSE
ncbi:unnamed protein product [Psylliodes chrysocephalus]|uniref:p53 DNA-binding domain-containing protein n=1 Tax=Psylliodes chrysocephalus TaxID=3402493 RepID=A0A9P0D4G6_9CUCU|nr:unnamed protein product [Psylliodes chrysocephala]